MTNQGLTLLTKTLSAGPAHVIKSALEAEGIPAFVLDDHPAGLGVGLGIINARVMVLKDDLEAARNVLIQVQNELDY